MKEINIKTLEAYNKKYSHCKSNLIKFTKKEVEDFDKQFAQLTKKGIVEKNYLLKSRKWVLIDNTYYEIPKAPRWTWFRNLNLGIQTAVAVFGVGAVTTAITVPTVLLNNKGGVKPQPEPEPVPPGPEPEPSTEGKLFHVYCWNDEVIRFFNKYISDEGKELLAQGKIMDDERVTSPIGLHLNGTDVKFTLTPSNDGKYLEQLNEALKNNKTASEEDKVDLFLVEPDYMNKYVNSSYSKDINKVGVTNDDMQNVYEFTKELATDSDGVCKGVTFQVCPSALIYRRSAAKNVIGSDDPAEVQKTLNDWDSLKNVAKIAKAKDYTTTPCVEFLYKPMTVIKTSPWVTKDNVLNIPDEVTNWCETAKELIDNECAYSHGIWSSETQPILANNNLCAFGPAWYYNFCMSDAMETTSGDWAVVEGPQNSFWGGTWMLAAEGGDNDSLVAKTMKEFINNESEVLNNLVNNENVLVNNNKFNKSIAPTLKGNEKLGGQNDYEVLIKVAENIKIDRKNVTKYDQSCDESYQSAFKDYFDGKSSIDEALKAFKDSIKAKHPEITVN